MSSEDRGGGMTTESAPFLFLPFILPFSCPFPSVPSPRARAGVRAREGEEGVCTGGREAWSAVWGLAEGRGEFCAGGGLAGVSEL